MSQFSKINVACNFPMEYEVTESMNKTATCQTIRFTYNTEAPQEGRQIDLAFSFPMLDICGRWFPTCNAQRNVIADWFYPTESMTSISAPIVCFFNGKSENRCTIALSETKQRVLTQYGVHEEDGTMLCRIRIALPKGLFLNGYEITIWKDMTCEPYWETISSVRKWWETDLGLVPMEVPAIGREPMYSFWYSQHQNITAESVEKESKLAADMGFSSVIVDDGWQTEDNNRGYAFCGDWEVAEKKFPDMAAHVKRVQDMGLKYLIWFSVPFIGKNSKAWSRFEDKLVCFDDFQNAAIFDIRYPEVREYLKNIYINAVKEWNIDGLKLDFIDEFYLRPESPIWKEGMDVADIQEALGMLLTEVMEALKAIRPDIMIEFRQRYVGPQIRRFGNLLRVADCPGSGLSNRIGTIDLRLLSGSTCVHSDMLMWHKDEKPEDAALQVTSCLFSTMQFSVNLADISDEMKEMTSFWMDYMRKNVKLLQEAQIEPLEPENLYPEVRVRDDKKTILAHYSRGRYVDLSDMKEQLDYVHAVKEEKVFFVLPENAAVDYQVLDCSGKLVEEGTWSGAFAQAMVPTSGVVVITRK